MKRSISRLASFALAATTAACGADTSPSFLLDTGNGADTSGGDAGGSDTGGDAGGSDTGGEDTGSDTGGEDTGSDTGGEDTGDDTGGEDTGDDAGGSDAGDDAGGSDAGDDAGGSDAGDDAGGSDAGDDAGGSDAGDDAGGSDTGDDAGGSDAGDDAGGSDAGMEDTGSDAMDPCADVDQCDPETFVASCDGDTLLTCGSDAAGCNVEQANDCGASGGTCNADTLSCDLPAGACSIAGMLDCSSGTVNGDTANGTFDHDDFECTTYSYPGLGEVWEFTADTAAEVTITSVRISGSGDYDLYALTDDLGCDQTSTCLGSSVGTSDTETVTFATDAGDTTYIFYDLFNSTDETTTYTLEVSCTALDCGDGVVAGVEECDDANSDAGDGCSAICQIEPGYVCESGDEGISVCRETVCGDERIEGSEECDAGGDIDGCIGCVITDGFECTGEPSDCVPTCGNGVVDADEECDDDNLEDDDGCTRCVVDEGYVCEPVDFLGPSVCRETVCGDGITEGTEECDTADPEYTGVCREGCILEDRVVCDDPFGEFGYVRCYVPGCGDGVLEAPERCDMGGADSGLCTAETCEARDGVALIGAAVVPDTCVPRDDLDYSASCGEAPIGSERCRTDCAFPLPINNRLTLAGAITLDDLQFDRRGGCEGTASDLDHDADVYWLTNNTDRDLALRVSAEWSADGFLFLWRAGVDINDYEGCLAFDDDFNGTGASWIEENVPVAAGESVLVVATNFNPDVEIDEYTLFIDTFSR